jgi:hypothetical protein
MHTTALDTSAGYCASIEEVLKWAWKSSNGKLSSLPCRQARGWSWHIFFWLPWNQKARIQRLPQAFRTIDDHGTRKVRLHRFPYTVYYVDLDDSIWIAAAAHQKRRPGYWSHRDPGDLNEGR